MLYAVNLNDMIHLPINIVFRDDELIHISYNKEVYSSSAYDWLQSAPKILFKNKNDADFVRLYNAQCAKIKMLCKDIIY